MDLISVIRTISETQNPSCNAVHKLVPLPFYQGIRLTQSQISFKISQSTATVLCDIIH